jgi:hypothetical protein
MHVLEMPDVEASSALESSSYVVQRLPIRTILRDLMEANVTDSTEVEESLPEIQSWAANDPA